MYCQVFIGRFDGRYRKRAVFASIVFFAGLVVIATSVFAPRGYHLSHWPLRYTKPLDQRRIPSKPYVEVVDPADDVTFPYSVYRSHPARPPRVLIEASGAALAEGYFFVTAQLVCGDGELTRTPYVFDSDGELVFAATPDCTVSTGNFRAQNLGGRPYLTTWRGQMTEGASVGHAYGEVVFWDEEYEETVVGLHGEAINANVVNDTALRGFVDVHEQRTTERGSVLVTVYNITTTDASHAGGSADQWVMDGLVYEIDVVTEEVTFAWSALDHIHPAHSWSPVDISIHGLEAQGAPWDAFHLNSVEPVFNSDSVKPDQFLISCRSTHSIYLVNRDGSIAWTLFGGDSGEHVGDFGPLGKNGTFAWQHDARLLLHERDRMIISLFDNHRNDTLPITTLSRGIVLELALPPDPAISPKVLRSTHVENESAAWQGNYQADLSNGNELLSYGDKPFVVEFGPGPNGSREERWRARFGFDRVIPSYRGWKMVWKGTPKRWDPSLVAEVDEYRGDDMDRVVAYVSWNGATDIAYYQLYCSSGKWAGMRKIGTLAKQGFETTFHFDAARSSCLQIGAVSSKGVERMSNVVCLSVV